MKGKDKTGRLSLSDKPFGCSEQQQRDHREEIDGRLWRRSSGSLGQHSKNLGNQGLKNSRQCSSAFTISHKGKLQMFRNYFVSKDGHNDLQFAWVIMTWHNPGQTKCTITIVRGDKFAAVLEKTIVTAVMGNSSPSKRRGHGSSSSQHSESTTFIEPVG